MYMHTQSTKIILRVEMKIQYRIIKRSWRQKEKSSIIIVKNLDVRKPKN